MLFSMLRKMNRHVMYWHRLQNWHLLVLAITTVVFAPAILFILRSSKGDVSVSSPSLGEKWNSIRPMVQFSPTLEYVNGSEVIWQIPESAKGVLFIAHGCHGKAVNFWDRSPNCPNCVGLPEERLLVLHALVQKYAVITISSTDVCWSFRRDKKNVKSILEWWVHKKNIEKLPMVALGASSGGYFISALATEFHFDSITIMIAEGVFEAMESHSNYPPTLFVHMPKDRRRMSLIAEAIKLLKRKGIDVAEVRCPEFPLTPTFLSDRIPGLDEKTSRKIHVVLKERGILNEKNYMMADGRAINWRKPLREKQVMSDGKNEWEGHIQEELNLAYGYHEMTSLQSGQIFQWFDSHLSKPHQTN